MRKIKSENIKVGDYFYVVNKNDKNRKFMVKIIEIGGRGKKDVIDWWVLTSKLFEEISIIGQRDYGMDNITWKRFDLFRLNKKEVTKFHKLLILKNLE